MPIAAHNTMQWALFKRPKTSIAIVTQFYDLLSHCETRHSLTTKNNFKSAISFFRSRIWPLNALINKSLWLTISAVLRASLTRLDRSPTGNASHAFIVSKSRLTDTIYLLGIKKCKGAVGKYPSKKKEPAMVLVVPTTTTPKPYVANRHRHTHIT